MTEESTVSDYTTEIQCGSCEDEKATGYCRDCEEGLCDECIAAHRRVKFTRSHPIVPLDHDEPYTQTTPKKEVPNCPDHPSHTREIYCGRCSVVVCIKCAICLHREHGYDLLADVFPRHKEELVSNLKPVKQKLQTVEQALKAFDTRAKEINDQRATLEAHIHKEIDQLHQLLDQQRAQLVSELDMVSKEQIEIERNQLENSRTKASSLLAAVENTLQADTDLEIMEKKATICQEIQTVLTDSEVTSNTAKGQISITPFDVRLFNEALTTINIIRPTQEEQLSTSGVGMETQTPTSDYEPPVSQQETDIQFESDDIMPKSKRIKLSETPTDNQISIPKEEPTGMIKKLKSPWKIAHNSEDNVIITELQGNRVSIYDLNGQLIKTFGGKGSKKGKFNYPSGVAVDDEDNIYIAEYNGHRIQKFSQDGTFLLAAGTRGQGSLQFDTPDGVGYNKHNQKIYVCEEVNCRIQVLNKDLTLDKMFGKRGIGNEALNGPSGIDFDKDGNVYVADTENHRIQVFTPEGNFIRNFGTFKLGIRLQFPTDIAICHGTGMVYVTTITERPVMKFNKEGEYIGYLRGKSSKEGRFKRGSTGITISTDSTILVTDRGNGRVHTFSTSYL